MSDPESSLQSETSDAVERKNNFFAGILSALGDGEMETSDHSKTDMTAHGLAVGVLALSSRRRHIVLNIPASWLKET